MGLFKKNLFKKEKKRIGKSSIREFRSPYLKKNIIPDRKRKRIKKKKPSLLPPTRLQNFNKSKLKRISLTITSFIFIVGIIYLIFLSPIFEIKEFKIINEGTMVTNNLELNEFLTTNLLKKNLFSFPEQELRNKLLNSYPEIEKIEFRKMLPNKIELEFKKYPSIANLINVVKGADGIQVQKKYLLNSHGMITNENEEDPELGYIKIYSTEALGLKSTPISAETLDYMLKLINLFEEKFGIEVLEAEYLKTEREIHLKTEKLFYVWIDSTKDMNTQIDKLKEALSKIDIYKTPLKYIDLRISTADADRVIFCPIDKPCAHQN